jgi:S-adenosylmethionine decarboxylase
MYDLQGDAYEIFNSQGQSKNLIRERTNVHQILEGFEVDDHVFEPFGYSLNAINGDNYYTIHVTPHDSGPYVSFETNIRTNCDYDDVIKKVLGIFKPMSYDIVFHSPAEAEDIKVNGEIKRSFVRQKLSCGYHVQFVHFFNEHNKTQNAFKLDGN